MTGEACPQSWKVSWCNSQWDKPAGSNSKKSLPAPLMSGFGHPLTAPCHWQTVARLLSSPSWWNSSTDLVERTPWTVTHTRQAPSASQTHRRLKQSLPTILKCRQGMKAVFTHYTDAHTGSESNPYHYTDAWTVGECNPYPLYWCQDKGVKAIRTHYTDAQRGVKAILIHYTDAHTGGESNPYPLYWCPDSWWKQSLPIVLMPRQLVTAIPTHHTGAQRGMKAILPHYTDAHIGGESNPYHCTDARTAGESNPYPLYWCPDRRWKQSLPTVLMPRQEVKAIPTHCTDAQTGGESSPYPLYWCPGFCLPGGLAPQSWTDPRHGFPQQVSHQQQGTSGAERQAGWWLLLLRLLHCWWMKGAGRAPWQGKHCATHSERSWKLSDLQHWKCNTHRQTHEYQLAFACSCCATDLCLV